MAALKCRLIALLPNVLKFTDAGLFFGARSKTSCCDVVVCLFHVFLQLWKIYS